jgi:hypothetical protein
MRSKLVVGHANGFWLLNRARILSPLNLCPGFWQLIRSSRVSTSARSFVRPPPTMQSSCPGPLLVTRAGFTVMTLRQSNNPPSEKVQTHWDQKRQDREEQSQKHAQHVLWHQRDCSQKNSSWQVKQSIWHITVAFYGDCVKICKDFAQNFDGKRNGCCIMTMHHHILLFPL